MKKNIKYKLILLAVIIISIFAACKHEHTEGDGHNHGTEIKDDHSGHNHGESDKRSHDGHDHGDGGHGAHEEGSLKLTKDQIKTIDLEFGGFSAVKVNDYVKATGTLGLPPNAYSSVTAKAEGIINSNKKFVEGDFVKKGEIIAQIENPKFIKLQQEYLESKVKLKYLKIEKTRQQKLVDANAGVVKKLQEVTAELEMLTVTTNGLSKQLSYLGINADNLNINSISQRISIRAPMSGFITSIDMNNGMYVQPSNSIMEIVEDDHLHLELDVFEKDIASVEVDQEISYTIPALGNTIYKGEISVIGKEFDTASKTVRIHGHLEGVKPRFIKDLFINAKIWLNDNTSTALPESAIVKDGPNFYIYVGDENLNETKVEFQKIMVIPGANNDGYTAVKLVDSIPVGMKIVTKGAYYVYAQSKAGELAHEH